MMPESGRPQGQEPFAEKVWHWVGEATYILVVGALWLLCSLPVVTIGAATTAMYTVYLGHIDLGRKEMARPFFVAFRRRFKEATLLWLALLAGLLLFGVDAWYYLVYSGGGGYRTVMGWVMLCLFSVVAVLAIYAFPVLARYERSFQGVLAVSAWGALERWPWTLLALGITLAVPLLVKAGLWQLILFGGGIVGMANSHIMLRAFGQPITGDWGVERSDL